MNIIFFALGCLCGFGLKLGFDEYHKWQNQQKKTYLDMEDILVKFKAIEMLKKNQPVPKDWN